MCFNVKHVCFQIAEWSSLIRWILISRKLSINQLSTKLYRVCLIIFLLVSNLTRLNKPRESSEISGNNSRVGHLTISYLERKFFWVLQVMEWLNDASNSSHTALYLLCSANLCKPGKSSSDAALISKPLHSEHVSRLLLHGVWVEEVASCGQSVGRHHLVIYEPTESCVSTGFNGLLYSLLVKRLEKQWAAVCHSRVQGQTCHWNTNINMLGWYMMMACDGLRAEKVYWIISVEKQALVSGQPEWSICALIEVVL